MPKQALDSINIRLIYDGKGPVTWSRDPGAFGLQDKAGVLHRGAPSPDGTVVFDLTLQLKPEGSDAPVLTGSFAHGPPAGRFLYLGWRNDQAGGDKHAADNSTAGRMRRSVPLPNTGSKLIGSYATVARLLDEMAEIEGVAGVMLTFDDFVIGVEQFGQRIQPLMKSRRSLAQNPAKAA